MWCVCVIVRYVACFCFQAEDGIRDRVRSRGLGDVYKRQLLEMGASGQRCGCRTLEEGLALAHAIHASAVLRLSLIHI